jgi:chromate reductase, NAD(P)H dehydrogenase (quinone)
LIFLLHGYLWQGIVYCGGMNTALRIAVMIGSIRKERQSHKPAEILITKLEAVGVEIIRLDLRDLDLPLFDDGIDTSGRTTLLDGYKKMDGMIIVAPEYNHSAPGAVKNAIDFAREKELTGKPVTVVGVSRGVKGGARMIPSLRNMIYGVNAMTIPTKLEVGNVMELDPGRVDEGLNKAMDEFIAKSLHWFQIIKDGKAANPTE